VSARVFVSQQRSFDDLGTPLHEVTFCVLDLETTGGSPAEHAITEIGAVKYRGGERLGHFETLVNPGMAIPPLITVLTGITEAMVLPAPRIGEVLPHFLEFLGDAVIVGHNVRFDIGFLDAALVAHGYAPLAQRRTDTLALARRLVRDEVPNLKLGTLARHLRVPTEPNHRAMADAAATAEVFHMLLERAASFGVLGLDDLLNLPSMHAHPSAQKLGLTTSLPRAPGVYVFRDRNGLPLYVGKATNLRARVRSYFSGDDRRKIPQLLREVARIDHVVCHDPIEAAVREIRLIQQWQPRFNRQGKTTRRYTYVKLTEERFPRIVITRIAKDGDGIYLGPLPSKHAAQLVREAIETAVPLRRCSTRLSRRSTIPVCDGACTAAQLGTAACPCAGTIDDDAYAEHVATVRRALVGGEPELLLDPLHERMQALAAVERFEEAAATRDRLEALARALRRRDAVNTLRSTPRLVLHNDLGSTLEVRFGRLVLDAGPGRRGVDDIAPDDVAVPPTHDEIDELVLMAGFVARAAPRWRLSRSDGTLASPLPRVPRFEPSGRTRR
jgi:DNA polymerase-3 subunit epsilon